MDIVDLRVRFLSEILVERRLQSAYGECRVRRIEVVKLTSRHETETSFPARGDELLEFGRGFRRLYRPAKALREKG